MFNHLISYPGRNTDIWNFFDTVEKSLRSHPGLSENFRTDIVDMGDHYQLQAELPGFDKEEIKIDVEDNRLVISAQKDQSNEEKTDQYVRRERRSSSYSRAFDISEVDEEAISAAYENGILTLQLPKKQPAEQPTRQIPIQ